MRAKDGRRFFLKNTAPNLAGAELQELVRSAIESNGGRITTSQNPAPKDDGRFKQIIVNCSSSRRRRTCRRSCMRSKCSSRTWSSRTSRCGRSTRFAGSSRAGQEPEVNVQLDVAAFAFAEPEKK